MPQIERKKIKKKTVKYIKNVERLRLVLSKRPNEVGVFSPVHLRTETDPVSETSRFLFSRIWDDGKSPKTQQFYLSFGVMLLLLMMTITVPQA
jgi:hypothetical protein